MIRVPWKPFSKQYFCLIVIKQQPCLSELFFFLRLQKKREKHYWENTTENRRVLGGASPLFSTPIILFLECTRTLTIHLCLKLQNDQRRRHVPSTTPPLPCREGPKEPVTQGEQTLRGPAATQILPEPSHPSAINPSTQCLPTSHDKTSASV